MNTAKIFTENELGKIVSTQPKLIVNKGKIYNQYNEGEAAKYMKGLDINITIDIGNGKKSFTVYTMDLTNEYIKINSDYRS